MTIITIVLNYVIPLQKRILLFREID
jgi:hypothetical protein